MQHATPRLVFPLGVTKQPHCPLCGDILTRDTFRIAFDTAFCDHCYDAPREFLHWTALAANHPALCNDTQASNGICFYTPLPYPDLLARLPYHSAVPAIDLLNDHTGYIHAYDTETHTLLQLQRCVTTPVHSLDIDRQKFNEQKHAQQPQHHDDNPD